MSFSTTAATARPWRTGCTRGVRQKACRQLARIQYIVLPGSIVLTASGFFKQSSWLANNTEYIPCLGRGSRHRAIHCCHRWQEQCIRHVQAVLTTCSPTNDVRIIAEWIESHILRLNPSRVLLGNAARNAACATALVVAVPA